MKVKREDVVKVYVALGLKNADRWDEEKLTSNLSKIPELIDEEAELDEDVETITDLLWEALENDEEIEITGPSPKKKKASPGKRRTKKAAPTSKKATKGTKKGTKGAKKKASPSKSKKPGVIASIVEFAQSASKTKPLSIEQITKRLSKRFSDRDPEGMEKTARIQLGGRLAKEKGLDVNKNDKGYWIS